MKTVLVTGGAGYIGSHACKALKRAGWNPVTYDSLATGWRDAVKFGPLVQGDLLDTGALARAFDEHIETTQAFRRATTDDRRGRPEA